MIANPSQRIVRNSAIMLVVGAAIVWSYLGTEANFLGLVSQEGRGQIYSFLREMFPPDLSSAFLVRAGQALLETVAISFMGTVIASLLALCLIFFATRTLILATSTARPARLAVYLLARGLLTLLRSIPEIVWALLFILALGLGPFPGTLALGIHTAGVLGKLYSEVMENVDPAPLEALEASGASRWQMLAYGIMPQALPQFISYTLYRWEVNIRAAAILGFVGAGGIGQEVHIALNLFLGHKLLTLLFFTFVMVSAVDYLSAIIRRRFI
ncbi:MAG: phosphonate ABC transporter, permease protein PhnE [Thermodesulfobacteriota bacterium]